MEKENLLTKSVKSIKLLQENKNYLQMTIVQTRLLDSNLKLELKGFTVQKMRFLLIFLFRSDQNDYFSLTSKNLKICEQISKEN